MRPSRHRHVGKDVAVDDRHVDVGEEQRDGRVLLQQQERLARSCRLEAGEAGVFENVDDRDSGGAVILDN